MLPLFTTAALRWPSRDAMLLLLRVATGCLLCFGHGVGKWQTWRTNPAAFPDPLGLGPEVSILTSMACECGASMLVAVGLSTRLACIPILFTMSVVALVVHRDHTWLQTEPSVLFFLLFGLIAYLGPGRFSLDARLQRT